MKREKKPRRLLISQTNDSHCAKGGQRERERERKKDEKTG